MTNQTEETTTVQPTVDSVRDFWESHVNNEYYTRKARGSESYFDEIERRRYGWHYHLADYFARLQDSTGRLLEIGCGIGVDSIQLAKCGFDVTAVDLTETAIEVAREYAQLRGQNIDFQVGNSEKLNFDDQSFDAVYSFGVLHHTPDIDAAIAEVRRVLKPGGTADIMLYHKHSIVNFVHRTFNLPYESRKDHCPVVYTFTEGEARELFKHFSSVAIVADYPFTYGFRYFTFWVPVVLQKALGKHLGWHLMIRATR